MRENKKTSNVGKNIPRKTGSLKNVVNNGEEKQRFISAWEHIYGDIAIPISCEIFLNDRKGSNILAYASITFFGEFVVRSLRILNGRNGIWVAFPQILNNSGEYSDIAFPITADFRNEISDELIALYDSVIEGLYESNIKQ